MILKKMDEMLGSYSRIEEESHQDEKEVGVGLESSGSQQDVNPFSEDFRSLLNIFCSRGSSEITIETFRKIYREITSQVTRKLDEMKITLNYQLLEAINSASTKQVLLSIQNTQGRAFNDSGKSI